MIGELTWSEAADRAREIRRMIEDGRRQEAWERADQLARDCEDQGHNEELKRRQAEPPLTRPYLDT